MYKLCLVVLSALVATTFQAETCKTPAVAEDFKFEKHSGQYFTIKNTANPQVNDLSCISVKFDKPDNKIVHANYTAFNKTSSKDFHTESNITWTNNEAIVSLTWPEDHGADPTSAYILWAKADNTTYTTSLWYTCKMAINDKNESVPVENLGVLSRETKLDPNITKEIDELLEKLKINVTLVDIDVNLCSASAQTTLSLALLVIALFYCLISRNTNTV